MEIERINENTVKFYISYIDIEDRGFEREEIWYNRERSEQLFWQMMEEVNYKEDFNVDGPLWIQVQAMEKGLEIVVTKAQMAKNGEDMLLPEGNEEEETIDISVDEKIENMLDDKFGNQEEEKKRGKQNNRKNAPIIVNLQEFEDVIQLSHYFAGIDLHANDRLFHYDGSYYLFITFVPGELTDNEQKDIISQINEFASGTKITPHVLREYGTVIFPDDTFREVRRYFSA